MFNVGREFNKFASTQGAGFFGALPRANQSKEMRFAGNALNNITRYKSALEGIEAAEREESKNRSNNFTNTLIGVGGNVVGTGLSAGIKHGFNFGGGGGSDGFSAADAEVMGMPSGQADVIGQGGTTYWDTDMPTNSWLNMGSGGGNAQGQNPYSINTTGW
tara:strand:- start:103 stop:585 length:483 start_codon:yes stop_codon:yes gene_type:complete